MKNQLKIQIWSDIACPFCYIGKRKLEQALQQFDHKDDVVIEWKSFQLDTQSAFDPEDNSIDYVAKKYGRDRSWSEAVHESVTQQAKSVGLDYHFESVILANTLNAHRLLHLAKKHNLGNELKEILFKAYFCEGIDINNQKTLSQLASQIGLNTQEIEFVLQSDTYISEVELEMNEAISYGVNSVPFFVFNGKYAVRGAQASEIFLETLEKSWEENNSDDPTTKEPSDNSNSCSIEGCE